MKLADRGTRRLTRIVEPMRHPKTTQTVLGAAVWLVTLAGLTAGIHTVRSRAARTVHAVRIEPGPNSGLAAGDLVFYQTNSGLKRAGEVEDVSKDATDVTLGLHLFVAEQINATTIATCWRTPLTAEQAISALLPPDVQDRVARQITDAWRVHDEEMARIWGPLMTEMAGAYLTAIGDDLHLAIDRRADDLWRIAQRHGDQFLATWPTIQDRLRPVIQEHLTPVLGRLIHDAVDQAPKMRIAWSVARGNSEQAFQGMLDSLADYFADMPEEDRAEVAEAVRTAWEAAARDETLADTLGQLGHAVIEDMELRRTLAEIYREAITDNPRTEAFFRTHILESPQFRKRLYEFMDLVGPTAQQIAATFLFDDRGATRPEVVHLVRSVALGRRVSWVTLSTADPDGAPLPEGAALVTLQDGAGS